MGPSPDTRPQATVPGRRQRGSCIKSGGGMLEGHPLGRAPRLAEGRRPPLCGHRPAQAPSQAGFRSSSLSSTQRAHHPGPSAWFCAVFLGILMDLRLTVNFTAPCRRGWIQEARAQGSASTPLSSLTASCHSENVSPTFCKLGCAGVVGIRGALSPGSITPSTAPTVTARRPLHRLCPGHLRPHVAQGAGVPLLNTSQQEQDAHRALYYRREGTKPPPWARCLMAVTYWSIPRAGSSAHLSWQVGHMAPVASDFSWRGGGSSLCPHLEGLQLQEFRFGWEAASHSLP